MAIRNTYTMDFSLFCLDMLPLLGGFSVFTGTGLVAGVVVGGASGACRIFVSLSLFVGAGVGVGAAGGANCASSESTDICETRVSELVDGYGI